MSKVDIISGFLGAGKTTLIKKLIQDCLGHEKVVLIENEFGEIGIDGSFLKEAGIEITEMNSGCICCSLVGDFSEALKQVVAKYHPDRIIIEPSGVGKLSDVIKAVENVHSDELQLNSFVTVIDVKKCKTYSLNFGEFFNNQIEYASTIILSRTQDVSMDKVQEAIDIIKSMNTTASIITTAWDELDGQVILQTMENQNSLQDILMKEADICPECGHHHEHGEHCHHHADEVFTSLGKETVHTYTQEQLDQILQILSSSHEYGDILRAKGILPTPDKKWLHFDLVPGEYEIRFGSADYTGRICVIGKDLLEDKIYELFGVEQ